MKLVKLIKMCLNETYSRVRVGKQLSVMFTIRNSLKQGDALSPVLFNFAFRVCNQEASGKLDGLKLNVTCQLLVHADIVNILGGNLHVIKTNTGAVVIAWKEIGLKVDVDKTKCMVMSRD